MESVSVTKKQFFEKFRPEKYEWIGGHSPDLDWTETHIDFVKDKEENKTVGFRRTSSYGAPDEYVFLIKSSSNND